jgi:DNA-binding CsgD family transcriptional regulator
VDRLEEELLERTSQVGALRDLLEHARLGEGCAASIEGPAGIGKTSLLNACAHHAAQLEIDVLHVRGDELVAESSFAAVRELLWPELQNDPGALEGAARLAAPVFDPLVGEATADRDRAGAVLHGLYWLVASLTDRGPRALLIDDAHWLDAASARFVVYLARRIESLAVALVVAARPGEGAGAMAILTSLAASGTIVLRPPALSEQASAALVRRVLGARAGDELCRSCHLASAGNPFYLRELAAALRQHDGALASDARRIRTLGQGTIGRGVLVRLAQLGSECTRMAQAVAVLGPGSPLRHAATLAALDSDDAEAAADKLRAADLLAPGPRLSFVHSVIGELVGAQLPDSRRAALQRQAARVLSDESAPPNRIAVHLLGAEPYGEEWVVATLRSAARDAVAQGAPESAVAYLRRALDEPPEWTTRLEVLTELGRAETMLPVVGDFAALRDAISLATEPGQRAELALELALAMSAVAQHDSARAVLEQALEHEQELDSRLVERIEAALIGTGAIDLSATKRVLARTRRYLERAVRGEVHDNRMLASIAMTGAVTGLPAGQVAAFASQALEDGQLLRGRLDDGYVLATIALCWSDRLDEAALRQDEGIAEAQRRGSVPVFVQLAVFRSQTALRAGALDIAEDYGRRALDLSADLGAQHLAAIPYATVLLERGDCQVAAELVESVELDDRLLAWGTGVMLLALRGRLRVALGRLEPGLKDLLAADSRAHKAGSELSVVADWAPAAVGSLVALGRREEAAEIADRELAAAELFGAPRRHGMTLSLRGTIEDGERGLRQLEDGAAILERSPARLEHAGALVNLGVGLRERGQRQEARRSLSEALDIAHELGASALAERARSELIASGARPRRDAQSGPAALTPAEHRAAKMAADGLTNREIAQALFVSARTVEAQLHQAYAKLSIRSRAELGGALRAPTSPRLT